MCGVSSNPLTKTHSHPQLPDHSKKLTDFAKKSVNFILYAGMI